MKDWKGHVCLYKGGKEDILLFRGRLWPTAGEFRVLYFQLL